MLVAGTYCVRRSDTKNLRAWQYFSLPLAPHCSGPLTKPANGTPTLVGNAHSEQNPRILEVRSCCRLKSAFLPLLCQSPCLTARADVADRRRSASAAAPKKVAPGTRNLFRSN